MDTQKNVRTFDHLKSNKQMFCLVLLNALDLYMYCNTFAKATDYKLCSICLRVYWCKTSTRLTAFEAAASVCVCQTTHINWSDNGLCLCINADVRDVT